MSNTLRFLILLPALGPLVYYCLAIYSGLVYFRRLRKLPPLDRSFSPPVSILKPVRGLDHHAYENFASFCGLDYPDYEILFAVADVDDPIIPVIEKLQKDSSQAGHSLDCRSGTTRSHAQDQQFGPARAGSRARIAGNQ